MYPTLIHNFTLSCLPKPTYPNLHWLGGNTLYIHMYSFEEWRGKQTIFTPGGLLHPPGVKFRRDYVNIGLRGPFLTLTLGANIDPWGEFCPLGVKLVKLSPGDETLFWPLHSSK
jgi:hypothetical protein